MRLWCWEWGRWLDILRRRESLDISENYQTLAVTIFLVSDR
ncbi:Glucose-methanol-choline (GMC) oxidoreductase:NAD binding site [Nodularia spumigena CCY9414]|nr:Glucose-methanol-choline (GMC) oxidoreductase:NAD binding site [Nodularia spumigena CCY9414]